MNSLSRTLWALTLVRCGIGPVPFTVAADWNWAALREHPVRTAVGVSSLVLGLLLLVYRLLRDRVRAVRRARSYGSKPTGTDAAIGSCYRRKRRKRRVIHQPVSANPTIYHRRTLRAPKTPVPRVSVFTGDREHRGSARHYGGFVFPAAPAPYFGKQRTAFSVLVKAPDCYAGRIAHAGNAPPRAPIPASYRALWGSRRRYGNGWTPEALPARHREPWGSGRRYGAGDPLARTALPERAHYHGGSRTTAKEPMRDRRTGLPLGPPLCDKQRYGTKRYGGKLYSPGPKPYRAEEPPGYPFPETYAAAQAVPLLEPIPFTMEPVASVPQRGNSRSQQKHARPQRGTVHTRQSCIRTYR